MFGFTYQSKNQKGRECGYLWAGWRRELTPLSIHKEAFMQQHIVWAEFVPLWLTSTAGHPPCSICASAQPRLFTRMKSLQNKPQNPWPWPILNKPSWGQEDTHGSTESISLKVHPITDKSLNSRVALSSTTERLEINTLILVKCSPKKRIIFLE